MAGERHGSDPIVIVGAARTPMGGLLGDLAPLPAPALGAAAIAAALDRAGVPSEDVDEVVMGCVWSTRASVLDRDTGGRLTWVWDHGIVAPGVLQVLPNNPAGDLVWDFIASTQDPKRQIELLKMLGNGPANPAAGPMESPELQRIDCGYEPNYRRQIPINTKWYAENYERVQNDFLDLMSG